MCNMDTPPPFYGGIPSDGEASEDSETPLLAAEVTESRTVTLADLDEEESGSSQSIASQVDCDGAVTDEEYMRPCRPPSRLVRETTQDYHVIDLTNDSDGGSAASEEEDDGLKDELEAMPRGSQKSAFVTMHLRHVLGTARDAETNARGLAIRDEAHNQMLEKWDASRLITALEWTEDDNNPHLQITICTRRAFTRTALGLLLERVCHGGHAHIKHTIALDRAFTYCEKEGQFLLHDNRSQGRRRDIAVLEERCTQLQDPLAVVEACLDAGSNGTCLLHISKIMRFTELLQSRFRRSKRPYCVHMCGPPGTGKTRGAMAMARAFVEDEGGDPDRAVYVLPPTAGRPLQWWQGYRPSHRVVIVEELRSDVNPGQLFSYMDNLPVFVEFKGGSAPFGPALFIVTTPRRPDQMSLGGALTGGDEDIQQYQRRLDLVIEYSTTVDVDYVDPVVVPEYLVIRRRPDAELQGGTPCYVERHLPLPPCFRGGALAPAWWLAHPGAATPPASQNPGTGSTGPARTPGISVNFIMD